MTFKLNDAYYPEFVPPGEELNYLRFKERKFGRGCIDQWRRLQKAHLTQLSERLAPLEQMLARRKFLLDARPRFVDFDLHGMLSNFLYSGHYQLPAANTNIRRWYKRVSAARLSDFQS